MAKINIKQLKLNEELTLNQLKIKIKEICVPAKPNPNVQHFKCISSEGRLVYCLMEQSYKLLARQDKFGNTPVRVL